MKLVRFLMKLSQETVSIELKSGTIAYGTVAGVDMSMNVHLRKVTLTTQFQEPTIMDTMTVRGNNIRYIILNEGANLDLLLLDDDAKKKPSRRVPDSRGRGRGGRIGRGGRGGGRGRGRF
ncbi:hypothetical protein L596_023435 [Steinernema carpocapsae]|uniref:Probable small nuclear ribonucleoprotein Sm D1 n=1 Tax=Steinernema carpocapsae TaxID=34508 RepID=A0A4U5MEE2_STECR|nr:hypothetical protein L596_023435 [Steinernema carpocapsae]